MKHINVSLFVPHMGCPNTCIFCNQKTISGKCEPLTEDSVTSACQIAEATPHDINNSEIAFFGGSFTAIEEMQMTAYLKAASPFVGTAFSGIRISTRPDAIDEHKLTVLKQYGVTSIELGAQSMNREVLKKNERGHTPEDTVRACEQIRAFGFSLGLQMMTGLYGSTPETDWETALEFCRLKPDTVRIYPTVILQSTKLSDYYRSGLYTPPSSEESVALCAKLKQLFFSHNIKVIRMGLHSGGNVAEGFVAGAYHPAFGELVETQIYGNLMFPRLHAMPKGEYTVTVKSGEASKAAGHKRQNLIKAQAEGYRLTVRESPVLSLYDVTIEPKR